MISSRSTRITPTFVHCRVLLWFLSHYDNRICMAWAPLWKWSNDFFHVMSILIQWCLEIEVQPWFKRSWRGDSLELHYNVAHVEVCYTMKWLISVFNWWKHGWTCFQSSGHRLRCGRVEKQGKWSGQGHWGEWKT